MFVITHDLLIFACPCCQISHAPGISPHFDLASNFQSLTITWKNTEATQTQHGTLFPKMFPSVLN
jgi:hypothetical protein